MTYDETLDFLFNRLQSFHNDGAIAYKPGLEKALALSHAFGNPHEKFKSVHIGGTNGKGSTAHSLASVLMESGLKVGLYTSPHLLDFSERIRINGKPIAPEQVTDFVKRFKELDLTSCNPSFFELTTIMAFEHFAQNEVDIAVIEVGLGGRLDTTNIITPEVSVITNISFDHTALLGNTLKEIATEKAGIIKPGIPVVIGRRNNETDKVFDAKSPLVIYAQDENMFGKFEHTDDHITYRDTPWGDISSCLTGDCQPENMATILATLKVLEATGLVTLDNDIVNAGLKNVCKSTGLMGRWMKVSENPTVITDTAHNVDGWKPISEQLKRYEGSNLHVVLGFVSDKDFDSILELLPRRAKYYFTRPSVNRAAPAETVASTAKRLGLKGDVYPTPSEAYKAAVAAAGSNPDTLIYVGGSTFVVADFLNDLF